MAGGHPIKPALNTRRSSLWAEERKVSADSLRESKWETSISKKKTSVPGEACFFTSSTAAWPFAWSRQASYS
ncbi:hypothetical protein VP1G_10640 [Cytospora mali]|uniref:Uncharacterized protein n=1 Tax=Cytospora mali TaxID=578113 RepID=A0A194UT76_CYTMA|nr:hypothetical protein VP1G_10640 [Valsa mali var. pyri (nom. inval.)]